MQRDLNPLHTTFFCTLLYGALHYAAFAHPAFYTRYIAGHEAGDAGLLEYVCAAIVAAAAVVAIALAFRATDLALRAWAAMFALGLLFLLGEELNWGQLIFRWETTGWFARHNDEQETNLHNVTSWLDQKPRAALNVAIVVAGIAHPLLIQFGRNGLFGRWSSLAPTMSSLPAACYVVIAGLPKLLGLDDRFSHVLPAGYRVSEVEELFVYAFFLAYLLSLSARQQRA